MRLRIKAALLLSSAFLLMSAGGAMGSGYMVPEQSPASIGLAGAHIAAAGGADASYFNPANQGLVPAGGAAEVDFTYINLPSVTYTDSRSPAYNAGSRTEHFFLPQVYAVSPSLGANGKLRIGASLTYPAGLTKRWDAPFARATTGEFTLRVTEFTPTVSYDLNDFLSVAAGLRTVYGQGVVKSYAVLDSSHLPVTFLSRDLKGDDTDFGYVLAASLRPAQELTIAATYHSRVVLNLEGDAVLLSNLPASVGGAYSGGGRVDVPIPEVFNLAASYEIGRSTIELVWERTGWSTFDRVDFNYDRDLTANPILSIFDEPVEKNWVDTDAFRLGFSHRFDEHLTATAGIARIETPVPEQTLGFDLPDSGTTLYSMGIGWKKQKLELFGGYMYVKMDDRTVSVNENGINGTFSKHRAHLFSVASRLSF